MEPSPPVAPQRKLGRRKVLALLGAVAIVVGVYATWQILRPRSIGEVLSMEHLREGSDISVQGTITAVRRENTSYGPQVYLQLDGNTFCSGSEPWTGNLLGDPNGSYEVGESYQTTIHPQAFSINGDSAVWSSELACPFPALLRSVGVVFDAVSEARDMLLAYDGADAGGWSRYELRTQNETGYSPDLLPVDLLKASPFKGAGNLVDSANDWKALFDRFYLIASEAVGGDTPDFLVADRMTSLAAASSTNGTLRFVDVDSNGLVNSGDRLDVRLSTGSQNGWDTYIVRIGNWSTGAQRFGAGIHIILVGPGGPLEVISANETTSVLNVRGRDESEH